MRRSLLVLGACSALVAALGAPVDAQEECPRAVVFALPGVTWADVDEVSPPTLLALVDRAAAGSVSVRTVTPRTSVASGFATIGAGTRVRGGDLTGAAVNGLPEGPFLTKGTGVGRFSEIVDAADHDANSAVPGALGSALARADLAAVAVGNADLGKPPPTEQHYGRWTLLSATNSDGVVPFAYTEPELIVTDPTAPFGVRTDADAVARAADDALDRCGAIFVDHGDLSRVDELGTALEQPLTNERHNALRAADDLLEHVVERLDLNRDLLLVVSPTSPGGEEEVHLGVAIAAGPAFPPGSTITSATTRRAGIVTLPDVAPTVLEHFGIERPTAMAGRAWTDADTDSSDRVEDAVELDRESVFVHGIQAEVTFSFVIFQVLMYAASIVLLKRGSRDPSAIRQWLEKGALAVVAFPLSTYLATPVTGHSIGAWWFAALLVAIDVVIVLASALADRDPLGRLFAITGATFLVLVVDQVLGGPLQFNGVFGTLPIIAGRFAGLGNTAFTVLGTTALLTGALAVHRFGPSRAVLAGVAGLYAATIVVDGAPWLGSDVGGVVALCPALVVTWALLSGRRVTAKFVFLGLGIAVVALGAFLALDFARPPESRTHFARLVEDVRDGGSDLLGDTIVRKARGNIRVFTSTIWTYLVPPAVALMAWLLVRPRGRWRQFAETYPKLRAGLIGGLVLAVCGFFVNDSGIVIPALALSFLVPLSLLVHFSMEVPQRR